MNYFPLNETDAISDEVFSKINSVKEHIRFYLGWGRKKKILMAYRLI